MSRSQLRANRVSMCDFKSITLVRHVTPDGSQYDSKPNEIQRRLLVGVKMEKVPDGS